MRITRTIMLSVLILLLAYPAWAMENYTDVLRDQYGRAIGGATVAVYIAGTGALATIYSDNSSTIKDNPFLTDALDGRFNFYAGNGVYDIEFIFPGATFDHAHTRRIAVFDVNDFTSSGGSTNAPIPSGSLFPSNPSANYQFFLTSDSTVGDCNEGGGSSVTLCRYDGVAWVPVTGGGSVSTWPDLLATGPIVTSEANPLKICGVGALSDDCWHLYIHSNGNPIIRGVRNGVEGDLDIKVKIDEGNQYLITDYLDNTIMAFVPGASGMINKIIYGSSYRPTKTIYIDAGGMNVDGSNCTAPTEQSLNSAEKTWAFSCADSNSSIFSGKIRMLKSWDGQPVVFIISVFHGTTETITFAGKFSAQCRGAGDTMNSTYGTAVAANVSITTSNKIAEATSAAVTPDGACAGEKFLNWRYVVDASNFSANAANSKVLGVSIRYGITSPSD